MIAIASPSPSDRRRPFMTPLERSRFAAEQANEEVAQPLDPIESARQMVDRVRQNIRSHNGWSTGVGDCASDWKSCFAVMCCSPTVMGQLVERIWRRKYACIVVAVTLWIGMIGLLFSTFYSPPCAAYLDTNSDGVITQQELTNDIDANSDGAVSGQEVVDKVQPFYDCEGAYYSSARYVLASTLGSTFLLCACCLLMSMRAHIRNRDEIPVTVCAGLDDCLCAAACLPCVQCQLMRHEGLTGKDYRFISPDGTADFHGFSRVDESQML